MLRSLLILILSAPISFQALTQEVKQWTLQECVDFAVDNNLTIKRDRLTVDQNEVNLSQWKAAIYPNLNVNGSTGLNWGRSIDPTSNDFITQRIGFTSAGATSSVTLFNGFFIRNSVRQSKVLLESSRYDLETTQNDILFSVITFYTNVIFNKELLENARLQLNSLEQQVVRSEKLVEAGAVPRTELLNLQAQKATNELNVVNAQNNLNLAILQLKQLLQMPADEPLDVVVPDIDIQQAPGPDENAGQVYQTALASMPEIKSADLGVESSLLGIEIAKGGLYPSLRLTAGLNTNYSDAAVQVVDLDPPLVITNPLVGFVDSNGNGVQDALEDDVRTNETITVDSDFSEDYSFGDQFQDNLSRFVSVSLNIPIFNGFSARSDIQRAVINNKQAEIIAQETRNFLRQTIETAYNDVLAASESYNQSQLQVAALEESFRATDQRYNLGAVNFTDWQVANNNLFQARSDLLRAKYDYIFKKKVLDFYQGKPLDF